MNIIDWCAIVMAILLQAILFSNGMKLNKKIILYSAVSVYFGMILFFFTVLLSDVKSTTNSFYNLLSFENLVDANNLGPLITVIGTTFAYFSFVILSYGDFSRYVKNESEL